MTGGFGGWDTLGLKSSEATRDADLWSWMQSFGGSLSEGGKVGKTKSIDWEARREKVRDAFIVSWDSYAEHGWGTFRLFSISPSMFLLRARRLMYPCSGC